MLFRSGAGNGMMGEELKKHGVSRLIGVDIIPEAYEATVRDRPGLYDAYYVEDLTDLNDEKKEEKVTRLPFAYHWQRKKD